MPRVSKRQQHLNKHRKDMRQFEKARAFRIRQREEDDYWDEYEGDLVRDTISDESSSDGVEEEEEEGEEDDVDDNDEKGCEEIQAKTGTDSLGLSIFHSGSGSYLRV